MPAVSCVRIQTYPWILCPHSNIHTYIHTHEPWYSRQAYICLLWQHPNININLWTATIMRVHLKLFMHIVTTSKPHWFHDCIFLHYFDLSINLVSAFNIRPESCGSLLSHNSNLPMSLITLSKVRHESWNRLNCNIIQTYQWILWL